MGWMQSIKLLQFDSFCTFVSPDTLFPVLSSLPSSQYQPIRFQMSVFFFLIAILSHDTICVSPNFKVFILYCGIANRASLVA